MARSPINPGSMLRPLALACGLPLALLCGCSGSSGNADTQSLGGSSGLGGADGRGGVTSTNSQASKGGSTPTGGSSSAQSSSTLGGTSSAGGSSASGGSQSTVGGSSGGISSGGGSSTRGGATSMGGSLSSSSNLGGNQPVGGAQPGGSSNRGGSTTTGGTSASGGSSTTGGTRASGGTTTTGGTTSASGTGPTGGNRPAGGSTATGGTAPTGGTSSTGGSSSGNCDTPPEPSPLVGWAAVSGGTTGGGNATPVVVTTLADLQNAVKGTNAAVIHVKGKLAPGVVTIGSNKTIVGLCGAEIHGHVGLNKSSNVIIRNIKIVGYAVGNCALDPDYSADTGCSSGEDAITVQGQSTHLWFDHDDISDGTDGNLDITHASDYITVSWTKFHYTPRTDNSGSDSTGASGHRYSNLVGGSDSNGSEDTGHLRITWHHNWWADNVVERQPRIRFGQVHLFNNLWSSSTSNYCIGVGVGANIRDENNVFSGVKTPINTTSYSDSASAIRSTGNVYNNTSGNAVADLNAGSVFDPSAAYSYTADPASAVQAAVQSGAGPK